MADRPSLTEDAAEGLRSLFSRLGEFFHIFDLSFLVSGAATLGALAILGARLGLSIVIPSGWILGFALIITAYVCGLISFALALLCQIPEPVDPEVLGWHNEARMNATEDLPSMPPPEGL